MAANVSGLSLVGVPRFIMDPAFQSQVSQILNSDAGSVLGVVGRKMFQGDSTMAVRRVLVPIMAVQFRLSLIVLLRTLTGRKYESS